MNNVRTFFGIDPSCSNCGVAAIQSDGHNFNILQTWQISTKSQYMLYDRIRFIQESIDELISGYDPNALICMEQPFPGARSSAMLYSLFILLLNGYERQKRRVVAFHNSQAHYLIPGTRGIRKSAEIKKAAVKAFQAEIGYTKRIKADSAEAYFIAKHGARFWNFLDGVLTWEDLNEEERSIFVSSEWNAKKKMRKGMVYRPGDCYWDWSSTHFSYVTGNVGETRLSLKLR